VEQRKPKFAKPVQHFFLFYPRILFPYSEESIFIQSPGKERSPHPAVAFMRRMTTPLQWLHLLMFTTEVHKKDLKVYDDGTLKKRKNKQDGF
jgi:hypothetical protein